MNKVSIITINYNNEKGLVKTINSVENQSYKEFEFIIVDGNSDDDSKNVIERCKRKDKYISEKDKGVYNAMNKGIKMASNEYVIFMNSGDIFYDDFVLEKIVPELNQSIDLVYGNTLYYNDDGYEREEFPPKKMTYSFLRVGGINHQAAFIRKQLFYETFFYNEDYKICSDWEFFIRNICLNSISYKKIELFICKYDFSGISADPKNLDLYYNERNFTLNSYFDSFFDDFYESKLSRISPKRLKHFIYFSQKIYSWKIIKLLFNVLILFTSKSELNKFMEKT
ncbi:glycosyltransferase involved in cell wall biosynthesis [Wenyingzhuangia heitensis]|uniref:Glycosyltransferase involved in cell wall biosynthesis n=1 Tax=Wenyingzhuangia heitensis TaxID=1487859 RepID=A0ABX0UBU6_9FLAO|nr:glycosyltransferase family 2 protein [Wenyingzhuangia heitensis]NIJ45768.1 glycosyltransferase involved in cell wall biosynthesis [Wenyingzhuangia heitensis]